MTHTAIQMPRIGFRDQLDYGYHYDLAFFFVVFVDLVVVLLFEDFSSLEIVLLN